MSEQVRSIIVMQPKVQIPIETQSTESQTEPARLLSPVACSSAATSVIRMASPQKSKTHITEIPRRPLVKTPYVKTPKKIVVKFNKPFVFPVDEESNQQLSEIESMQQSEKPACSSKSSFSSNDVPIPKTPKQEVLETDCMDVIELKPEIEVTNDEDVQENKQMDDYPHSPLRSFTPNTPIESRGGSKFEIVGLNFEHNSEVIISDEFGVTEVISGDISVIESTKSSFEETPLDINDCDNDEKNVEVEKSNGDCTPASDEKKDVLIESWALSITSTITEITVKEVVKKKKTFSQPVASSSRDIFSGASTSSHSQPTTSFRRDYPTAGPSRIDYGLSSFLGFSEPTEADDFYSPARLSPIAFAQEPYGWSQRFSPQYVPFESGERTSYTDLDLCKNTNSLNGERAPSSDSLNIRTDEQMPAKGEISEQESNGDLDGSWSHQV